MPLSIPVPNNAHSKQTITLGGRQYQFTTSFNQRDLGWRLDINTENEPVISGLKLVENTKLLSNYILPDFSHGELFCIRRKSTSDPVGRDNLGIGKEYELIYKGNNE